MINIAHVVASLSIEHGGPSRTVSRLSCYLSRHDFGIHLLTQRIDGRPSLVPTNSHVITYQMKSESLIGMKLGLPLKKALNALAEARRVNIIHSHGIWLPINHWAAVCAREYRLPHVIHPRGMLEPWALAHSRFKKKLALHLFQRCDLRNASLFVATSVQEYKNIRNFGLNQPVAVIPNGVEIETPASLVVDRSLKANEDRVVLFLSRIHPKKGLVNLIRAWAQIAPKGWRLQIAGSDEGGHLREVMCLTTQLGIEHAVDYLGMVDGEAKAALYRKANLFVLPTYSENFGVVVAEALAYGLPVITTRGAPWEDLETYRCGWWVDIGEEPLVRALREATALSDFERQEMGVRGRNYVRRYDWISIAQQTVEVYRWLLGRGAKPGCIYVD